MTPHSTICSLRLNTGKVVWRLHNNCLHFHCFNYGITFFLSSFFFISRSLPKSHVETFTELQDLVMSLTIYHLFHFAEFSITFNIFYIIIFHIHWILTSKNQPSSLVLVFRLIPMYDEEEIVFYFIL